MQIEAADAKTAFKIEEASSKSALLSVTKQAVKAGKTYRLEIQTTGDLPVGPWVTHLVIRTDQEGERQIVIPVLAQVEEKPTAVSAK